MDWVRNPFSDISSLEHLPINDQEEFMKEKNDPTLKLKFTEAELTNFWLHVKIKNIDCFESVSLQLFYHFPPPFHANCGF